MNRCMEIAISVAFWAVFKVGFLQKCGISSGNIEKNHQEVE